MCYIGSAAVHIEDVKNKKMAPLLREVYDLILKLEKPEKERKKQELLMTNRKQKILNRMSRGKTLPARNLSVVSESESEAFNKSQKDLNQYDNSSSPNLSRTSQDVSPRHSVGVYKSMMCPLREKCPDDVRPRWPNSEVKSVSELGKKCPYAHHYSELHFKYSF